MSTLPTVDGKPLVWSSRLMPSIKRGWQTVIQPGSHLPGDFYVQHGNSFLDRAIQLTTRSHWNHAGAIVSAQGDVVEAVDTGLRSSSLSAIGDEFYIVHLENLTAEARDRGVAFIQDLVAHGDRYGWWSYPALILKALTRSRVVFEVDGTDICSEVVARMLEHMGVILPERPALVTPADLYNWFIRDEPAH